MEFRAPSMASTGFRGKLREFGHNVKGSVKDIAHDIKKDVKEIAHDIKEDIKEHLGHPTPSFGIQAIGKVSCNVIQGTLQLDIATTTESMPSYDIRDIAEVSLNFTQMLLKRLPDVASGNPISIALGLAKAVIEIKEAVKDNLDTTERRIVSIGTMLDALKDVGVNDWGPEDREREWLHRFYSVLQEEVTKLCRIRDGVFIRKIADHENEKSQIAESFERIEEARAHLGLYANIHTLIAFKRSDSTGMGSFLKQLKPSHMAELHYSPEGSKREALLRTPCAPGTRVHIIDGMTKWANGSDSHDIFFLHGPERSGKSTIAYTIARRFEFAQDPDDTIVLGGTFFSSRQFKKTRQEKCIIRTMVYQLAQKCPGFASALQSERAIDIDTIVRQSATTQIQRLLIDPWQRYQKECRRLAIGTARFLFIFDAADEVEQGGPSFLNDLLTTIRKKSLPGLRFFITSRSDHGIIECFKSPGGQQILRLQDNDAEVAKGYNTTYLEKSQTHLVGSEETLMMSGLKVVPVSKETLD